MWRQVTKANDLIIRSFEVREKRAYIMSTVEKGHGLKLISWILAYAVWLFIFLIPVLGIVVIIIFLLKNQRKSGTR